MGVFGVNENQEDCLKRHSLFQRPHEVTRQHKHKRVNERGPAA